MPICTFILGWDGLCGTVISEEKMFCCNHKTSCRYQDCRKVATRECGVMFGNERCGTAICDNHGGICPKHAARTTAEKF